ncbi:hypothetical protein BPY_17570 [Bifidobacterium psychraerophilum]
MGIADQDVQYAEIEEKGNDPDHAELGYLSDEFFHNCPFNHMIIGMMPIAWLMRKSAPLGIMPELASRISRR